MLLKHPATCEFYKDTETDNAKENGYMYKIAGQWIGKNSGMCVKSLGFPFKITLCCEKVTNRAECACFDEVPPVNIGVLPRFRKDQKFK